MATLPTHTSRTFCSTLSIRPGRSLKRPRSTPLCSAPPCAGARSSTTRCWSTVGSFGRASWNHCIARIQNLDGNPEMTVTSEPKQKSRWLPWTGRQEKGNKRGARFRTSRQAWFASSRRRPSTKWSRRTGRTWGWATRRPLKTPCSNLRRRFERKDLHLGELSLPSSRSFFVWN